MPDSSVPPAPGDQSSPQLSLSLQEVRANRLIYLVEDNVLQAKVLASQIGYYGYAAQTFARPADLEQALSRALPAALPAAILMDVTFPEGEAAGIDALRALKRSPAASVPAIFTSDRDDLRVRLEAMRAGAEAYFTKPVDAGALVEVLDRLLDGDAPIPYRVLIVDDSRIQAHMNSILLRNAGMETLTVTDPLEVLGPLADFNPDLILLDMYMPGCTGMELAQTLRQMRAFLSIPIVFLSAEIDRDRQLAAVSLGGDDFLTKPIRPNHLIAAVTSRVERYRQLHALMTRDSLTGVYNHTALMERLEQETARHCRQMAPLAFAMLDLDNFKTVNDTYGHPAGDRVLKSLAQMLLKRLRGSDVVGRYGGEEFSVIFPNTTGPAAVQVMQALCAGFAQIIHRAGSAEFRVTFSCGVAAAPPCSDATNLSEQADQALYASKQRGRRQVVYAHAG